MLDILGAVMTDQEIAAAGSEYRATVRDLGEVPLLPPVVTAKPVAEGFGLADLIARAGPSPAGAAAGGTEAAADQAALRTAATAGTAPLPTRASACSATAIGPDPPPPPSPASAAPP